MLKCDLGEWRTLWRCRIAAQRNPNSTINISTFKSKCIGILKDLNARGGKLTVTHRGKPLVRIESANDGEPARNFGAGRGSAQITGDLLDTSDLLEWEMDLRNLNKSK